MHADPDQEVEADDEEVAIEQREEADEHVRDGRDEVRTQLLLCDGQDVTHRQPPSPRAPTPQPASPLQTS